MEIPKRIREQIDKLYEADDNSAYVVDYKGQYLPKTGDIFRIRHIHHIDHDRTNNEIWNLVVLSYNDHIIEIHSKNNLELKEKIYEYMCEKFPGHEDHYKSNLLF